MQTPLSIKKQNDWILWTILLVGFLFRFYLLDVKPPHFDEGINGWFVDQLITQGFFRYDPTNYHGPFHFYVLFISKILFGRNVWALRMSASLFGVAALFVMAQFKTYVGKFTAYGAAFFAAVSPGMIFYSRYGIHESELLFFSCLALLGYFRFCHLRDKTSVWFMGLGFSGMVVTKETFIIHVACFFIAGVCLKFLEQYVPSIETSASPGQDKQLLPPQILVPSFVSILIIVVFYSGFFLNWQGVIDLFLSFQAWFKTGEQGNGHQKPFFYWLTLMKNYEWVALAGLMISPKLIFPNSKELRHLGIYGVGVFLAYSIVHYKTPWCILNIIWPFFFIAASVLADFARHGKKFLAVALLTCCLLGIASAQKAFSLNFHHFDDEKESYVYVQTFSALNAVWEPIKKLIEIDPTKKDESIFVMMDSSWPIPWILGDFTKGYFSKVIPKNPDGLFIIADSSMQFMIEPLLKNTYYKKVFKLRSSQADSVIYYNAEVFKDLLDKDAILVSPKKEKPLAAGEGLVATFYPNAEWKGVPFYSKIFPTFDFQFSQDNRPWPPPLSISFEGKILIPTSEPITFALVSDDGSALYIDHKEVINNLGTHAEKRVENILTFSKGWHPLEIKYNDFGGGMSGGLYWKLPGGVFEFVPSKNFKHKNETLTP